MRISEIIDEAIFDLRNPYSPFKSNNVGKPCVFLELVHPRHGIRYFMVSEENAAKRFAKILNATLGGIVDRSHLYYIQYEQIPKGYTPTLVEVPELTEYNRLLRAYKNSWINDKTDELVQQAEQMLQSTPSTQGMSLSPKIIDAKHEEAKKEWDKWRHNNPEFRKTCQKWYRELYGYIVYDAFNENTDENINNFHDIHHYEKGDTKPEMPKRGTYRKPRRPPVDRLFAA